MIAALLLVVTALVIGLGGSSWLSAARWPVRAPGLGIVAWLAVGLSVLLSVVLAGATLAVPGVSASDGVADFFHACSAAFREHYAAPGGAATALAGGVLAACVAIRFAASLLRGAQRARRGRGRQEALLRVLGRDHVEPDVAVIEHATPAAYCLPGGRGRIVVTDGTLELLSETELRQVLAHERAHLRARHHVWLLLAESISKALFERLGTGELKARVAELIEMHADDAVASRHRSDLARAVVLLGRGTLPVGALGAGSAALSRVRRLAEPREPMRPTRLLMLRGLALFVIALPVAIAFAPGVMAIAAHYCPVSV